MSDVAERITAPRIDPNLVTAVICSPNLFPITVYGLAEVDPDIERCSAEKLQYMRVCRDALLQARENRKANIHNQTANVDLPKPLYFAR